MNLSETIEALHIRFTQEQRNKTIANIRKQFINDLKKQKKEAFKKKFHLEIPNSFAIRFQNQSQSPESPKRKSRKESYISGDDLIQTPEFVSSSKEFGSSSTQEKSPQKEHLMKPMKPKNLTMEIEGD